MKNSIPLSQMLMRNNFCRRIKGLRVTPVQLAFVLLVGFPIGTTAQTTDKEVVVFDNAHSEVPYRIPALAYTRDGRLIAVCDYRISKSDIGINNRNGLWQINEVMRMSTDNGRTWGAVKTVAEGNELADDWHAAFGDPCIVAGRHVVGVRTVCSFAVMTGAILGGRENYVPTTFGTSMREPCLGGSRRMDCFLLRERLCRADMSRPVRTIGSTLPTQ